MLFVDVTSSCKSPLNTGVQRVVRALYKALCPIAEVQPLIWDDQLKSYCRLSAREQAFLSRANARDFEPAGQPEYAANPWPWSKVQRHFAHRLNRLDLIVKLGPHDALFVPEIFQDRRVEWLPQLHQRRPGNRRSALFYDAITLRHPELSPPSRLHRFDQYMTALASFDQVIAISEASAADLQAFWKESGVHPTPPVSSHALAVERAGERPKPKSSNSRRVLCVSTLEQRKNHLGLLRAAEKLWSDGLSFELELIGRTTRDWGHRVTAEIDRLATAGRTVRWHKHVDEGALAEAYANCRFTVFPSIVEGFGLPIIESLWHSKPCICGKRGAIAETARGGGCRLIDVTNNEELAAAMRELLTDDAALARLSNEAAARHFPTWSEFVEQIRPEILDQR
jgi:glycosyltransferase involved in cell wall biosynthesis